VYAADLESAAVAEVVVQRHRMQLEAMEEVATTLSRCRGSFSLSPGPVA
jgi:hypothetical protein